MITKIVVKMSLDSYFYKKLPIKHLAFIALGTCGWNNKQMYTYSSQHPV